MIIEGEEYPDIDVSATDAVMISQSAHIAIIDKQQAAKLVEVLQKWLAGEEVE